MKEKRNRYKIANTLNRYANTERYHAKNIDRKNPTVLPTTANHFIDKLSTRWATLSFEQKLGVIIISLLALGLTITAIYYLMPVISQYIKANPNTPPDFSQNGLSTKKFYSESANIITEISKHGRIALQPDFEKELKACNLNKVVSDFNQQAEMIRKLLPNVFNRALMKKVLMDSSFCIEIVPQNDPTLSANGQEFPNAKYLPLKNKMLIVADTDMTEEEALRIIRNEFHHAGVRYTNYKKQSNLRVLNREEFVLALRPFIKDKWQTDPSLEATHTQAIKKGFERIEAFEKLLNLKNKSPNSFLTSETKESLGKYLKSIESYQPIIHHEEFNPEFFKLIASDLKELPGGNYFLQLKDVTYYIRSIHNYDNTVVMKYTFLKSNLPKDKAQAFFEDMRGIKRSIDEKYNRYTESDKLLELSSFIQELEPEILETFFVEWCDYFSQYHNVEQYCRIK